MKLPSLLLTRSAGSWGLASLVFPVFIGQLSMVTISPMLEFQGVSEMASNRYPFLFFPGAEGNRRLSHLRHLSYPKFYRYSLPRSVPQHCHHDNEAPYYLTGAIDSGVVSNASNIEWHYVVPFAPEGTSNNVSSYLYWALELSSISVSHDQPSHLSLSPIGFYVGKWDWYHSNARIPIGHTRGRHPCAPRRVRIFAPR